MKLIDVTVPLDRALPTYPNNAPFTLEPIKRRARGDSSNVSTLHLSAHSGTHVDAPRHFFDDGAGADAAIDHNTKEFGLARSGAAGDRSRCGLGRHYRFQGPAQGRREQNR